MTTTENIRGALAEMGVPAERLTDEDILVLVERTNARLTALAAAASSGESNGRIRLPWNRHSSWP